MTLKIPLLILIVIFLFFISKKAFAQNEFYHRKTNQYFLNFHRDTSYKDINSSIYKSDEKDPIWMDQKLTVSFLKKVKNEKDFYKYAENYGRAILVEPWFRKFIKIVGYGVVNFQLFYDSYCFVEDGPGIVTIQFYYDRILYDEYSKGIYSISYSAYYVPTSFQNIKNKLEVYDAKRYILERISKIQMEDLYLK